MKILEEKNKLIEQLNETRKKFIKADIKYRRKKCRIMLECNFEEILQKSRPTVAEKEAYVELKTLNLKEKKEFLHSEIKKLELEISLCDNKLEVELQ